MQDGPRAQLELEPILEMKGQEFGRHVRDFRVQEIQIEDMKERPETNQQGLIWVTGLRAKHGSIHLD